MNLLYLRFFAGLFILIAWIMTGCQPTAPPSPQTYLYLGHPYDWRSHHLIDPRIPYLDRDSFDGIWFGGDVCGRTSKEASTIEYLDSLFDLSSSRLHWALGNHDLLEGDEQLITAATQRPTFYAHWQDGFCLLVLNTNLLWHQAWAPPQEDCERKQAQIDFILQLCDTIQAASHLVVIHHHSLFNELKINTEGDTIWGANINGSPIRTGCDSLSNFTQTIYPAFKKVQEKGIPVICAGGDYGMRRKRYAFTTEDGITLLGSGINNSLDMDYPPDYVSNFEPDSVLLFHYLPQQKALDWSFVHLGQLLRNHLKGQADTIITARVRQLVDLY